MRVRSVTEYPSGHFSGSDIDLPEVLGGGFQVWMPNAPQRLGLHSHSDWEFCLMVSGTLDWWIEGEFHAIRSGELFIIGPQERHDGTERIRYRSGVCWLCLAQPLAGLPGLAPEHAAGIAAGFAALSARRFAANAEAKAAFADVLGATRVEPRYRGVMARAALHRLLIAILLSHAAHASRAGSQKPIDERVQRACAILRERVGAPIAIAQLARAVGLSRTILHERFLAQVGVSPLAYWNHLRIERAKELLRTAASNGEVATALGFASAQHFAVVFRRSTGSTPRTWLANNR
jgi:AraC-like DNA-binding protein